MELERILREERRLDAAAERAVDEATERSIDRLVRGAIGVAVEEAHPSFYTRRREAQDLLWQMVELRSRREASLVYAHRREAADATATSPPRRRHATATSPRGRRAYLEERQAVPPRPIPSRPVPSHPVPSRPIPSLR